jgi:hypothetical protein
MMPTIARAHPPPERVEALLREVIRELRLLRQEVARHRRPSHLTRRDRAHLAAILPVIAGVKGSAWVLTRELVESPHAGLRVVLADLSARSLGRLLRRGEGEVIDGLTIESGGTEIGAVLWRILKAP